MPAPGNRTLTLSEEEIQKYRSHLMYISDLVSPEDIEDKVAFGDSLKILNFLPDCCVDLLVTDPPYNMTKIYGKNQFSKTTSENYEAWLRSWIEPLKRILKPTASIYVCSEWQSSSAVERVLREYFTIRNRITWEREKGRGAKKNWKNAAEDIWFCTVSDDYHFDSDAVRLKRKVIAPYRDSEGNPKDWKDGFRLTSPSNLWTDISVPFWSMPENTKHPTQKPEKLIAKLVLASSNVGDFVFDPFLGSGTTAVTAKKLNRHFFGIEREEEYALFSEKRLKLADSNPAIQGFFDGCFWERNSRPQKK